MSRNFFLQGFTETTYANQVKWVLDTPALETAIISVAFVSEDGVHLLEDSLEPIKSKTTFFCGIRNDITSYQGVLRLFESGHTVFLIDTGSRGRIFHPKIYLGKSATHARITVGSGNLTMGGLNNNIEAGLSLELVMSDRSDTEFINKMMEQFTVLPTSHPQNVFKVVSKSQLEALRDAGKLLDEAETAPPRPPLSVTKSSASDIVPRIDLPVRLMPSTVRRTTRKKEARRQESADSGQVRDLPVPANLVKVWESKPFGERALNIPSGTNTHATGALGLDKGQLDPEIDHRHYFRDEVFSALEWDVVDGRETEKATAIFQLIIKNQYYGEFELTLSHSTNTKSASYLQKNTMTYLSWGEMRSLVAKPDYIGRSLSLYANEANNKQFVIEID